MKVPFLELNKLNKLLETEINQLVQKTITKGWFIGGDEVLEFENDFRKYLDCNHCISCGNGTDALELILQAYEIGQGDEVLIPSFTWVSDAEAVVNVGAKPVFVDTEPEGFNISCDDIESKITDNTKAIIAVHLFGIPADIFSIKKLIGNRNIKIIEDCAQAHGAFLKKDQVNQKVGTIGDAGAFSFYPTKNLGALGDAGAITTNDDKLATRLRLLTNHGQSERDQHVLSGRNSRLDTLQAAILRLKLKYLDFWNSKRKEVSTFYSEHLSDLPLTLPNFTEGSVHHLYVVKTNQRDELKKFLFDHGIETAIHYPKSIHQMKAFDQSNITLSNTEVLSDCVLSLPCNPTISNEEAKYIVEVMKKFNF